MIKKIIAGPLVLLFLTCSTNKSDTVDKSSPVLAEVGNRIITVQDYLNRAELSLRPFYCHGNSDKDKRIILNSLIAEKMLAMEAGNSCDIFENETFIAYIKGRKEQLLRDKLFDVEARSKVTLDTNEVKSGIRASGMEYDVSFFNLDVTQAQKVQQALNNYPDSRTEIFDQIDIAPQASTRKITWLDNDIEPVQKALFTEKVLPGQVVGPLKLGEDQYIILKVNAFNYKPNVTQTDIYRKKQLVEEKLTRSYAREFWDHFVRSIMDGKKLEFNRGTYEALIQLSLDLRNSNQNEKIKLSQKVTDGLLEQSPNYEQLLEQPFFKIDNKTWSVRDFQKLVLSHPLVFRNDEIHSRKQFVNEFKVAIIDIIQDYYVTQEAYQRGYDRLSDIQRETLIWQDSFVAKYHQEKYLKSLSKRPGFDARKMQGNQNTYMDIYVDSLQNKYQNKIKINFDEFDKIQLTNTDLVAYRPGVPYQSLVPSFPANAIDDRLKY
ncbi:hypothetical protein JW824_01575 [bacterium]|nr:hypothetical protein [bacterium]